MTAWVVQHLHGVGWRDAVTAAVDVLVVAYLIYRGLLLVKGTRAAQMLTGLVLVAGGFWMARVFELTTVLWLLDNMINYSIIFLIVIFQHDIRRGLASVGANLFASGRQHEETYVLEEVIRAAEALARTRTGALFVLQREAELEDFLREPGELVEARVSKELLVALFVPSPQNSLHDGAVIIRNRRVFRAGCVMPLSGNRKLDKSLGTRHRAAIGITEETDAVVVVVSEERGSVSLCFGGNIAADLDSATLRKALLGLFQKERRQTARKGAMPVSRRPADVSQKLGIRLNAAAAAAAAAAGAAPPEPPAPPSPIVAPIVVAPPAVETGAAGPVAPAGPSPSETAPASGAASGKN